MAWTKSTRISVMLAIDTLFFLLELGVGIAVGSLALMADAFHMLNDIISLLVGLWAVRASLKESNEKYSFGWLRAEILGAFFNAVFLIALCLSIVLEAINRLIEPPEINNPKLILIVGCLGLASNLAGFFVLGGHDHSHGSGEDHEHDHGRSDNVRSAEEGSFGHDHQSHLNTDGAHSEHAGDVFPEAIVAKAQSHLRINDSQTKDCNGASARSQSKAPTKRGIARRTSRGHGRLSSIDDLSIHPASFRQELIAASRSSQLDGIASGGSSDLDDEAVVEAEGPTESSPLLQRSSSKAQSSRYGPNRGNSAFRKRREQMHAEHGHTKPKKASGGGHGHNHADMGMNAMILHVIGDALGNVGVIVSALIIMLTTSPYRFYADPAVSLFITLIILKSTIPLTKATAKILLQATPDHIDIEEIKKDIEKLDGVVNCHHIHVWQLSDTQYVSSLHVILDFPIGEAEGERYMEMAREAKHCLHEYGIHSLTIQPEYLSADRKASCRPKTMGYDGTANMASDDNFVCLMACVDDCEDRGCCSTSIKAESQHEHSDNEEHGHHHAH